MIKRIDTENHFASEAWVDALRKNSDGYPRLTDDPDTKYRLHPAPGSHLGYRLLDKLLDLDDGRIALLDEAGIDVTVLSLAAPGTEPFEPSLGTKVAKATNDALAEAIDRHPDRYLGYATLAPKDADAAAKELERCVKELGFRGWNTHSNLGDSFLDEKRYWPVLAKAEELSVPVYVHPSWPIIKEFQTYGMALAGPSFGFGAETALVAMRLIIGGVFDAFPKLQIILGHYAEGLPVHVRPGRPPLHPGPRAPRPRGGPGAQTDAQRVPARQLPGLDKRQLLPGGLRLHGDGHGRRPDGHRQRLPLRGHEDVHRLPRSPADERHRERAALLENGGLYRDGPVSEAPLRGDERSKAAT